MRPVEARKKGPTRGPGLPDREGGMRGGAAAMRGPPARGGGTLRRHCWASGVDGPSAKWRRRWTAGKRRAGHVWEMKKGVGRRERRPGERAG
jgi:hypothetical protein